MDRRGYDAPMHPHSAQTQNPGKTAPVPSSATGALAGELTRLQGEFSSHRIWREVIGDRVRYIARRTHPEARPHTVVTADLAELWATLGESRQPPASRG